MGYSLSNEHLKKKKKSFLVILKCCKMLLAGLLLTISFFYDVPDIDECESGIHNCLPDFICQNTLGSFRCRPKLQCKSGFIQDALGNCIGKTLLPGLTGSARQGNRPVMGPASRRRGTVQGRQNRGRQAASIKGWTINCALQAVWSLSQLLCSAGCSWKAATVM